MRAGTLIDYRIHVHGVPIRWRTEIAEWQPPHRFVDVQLSGPYRLWHHTHTFEDRGSSTLCRDEVRYWPRGGALIDLLFVRGDVERIFAYRRQEAARDFRAVKACAPRPVRLIVLVSVAAAARRVSGR